jgi:hypothetical protein
MAHISIDDLIRIVSSDSEYMSKWELGVPAAEALYIGFSPNPDTQVTSEALDACNGAVVVIDRDSSGRVCGIEVA